MFILYLFFTSRHDRKFPQPLSKHLIKHMPLSTQLLYKISLLPSLILSIKKIVSEKISSVFSYTTFPANVSYALSNVSHPVRDRLGVHSQLKLDPWKVGKRWWKKLHGRKGKELLLKKIIIEMTCIAHSTPQMTQEFNSLPHGALKLTIFSNYVQILHDAWSYLEKYEG